MMDNDNVESRGCDRNQEFPGHFRALAGEDNKRCFHFNEDKSKRCLCDYDRCNQHVMAETSQSPAASAALDWLETFDIVALCLGLGVSLLLLLVLRLKYFRIERILTTSD